MADNGARSRSPQAATRSIRATVKAARQARLLAKAPFSSFRVGAALETRDGTCITGCNIENATLGLTMCAERVALFKALSEGHASFRRVTVVTDTADPTPPCGPCRQLLWEYCGDVEVVLANLTRVITRTRLRLLFPLPFDERNLAGGVSCQGPRNAFVDPRSGPRPHLEKPTAGTRRR